MFDNKKIKEKLVSLEKEVKELKSAGSISQMRGVLQKSSEYKHRIEEKYNEITILGARLAEINSLVDNFNAAYSDIENAKALALEMPAIHQKVVASEQQIATKTQELEGFATKSMTSLTAIQGVETSTSDLNTKITAFHTAINKSATEINNQLELIVGYDRDDEHVEGVQEKLAKSYDTIKSGFADLKIKLDDYAKTQKDQYGAFLKKGQGELDAIVIQLKKLLPETLTKGLCGAYAKKRKTEEWRQRWGNLSFAVAIFFLSVISLIPFAVAGYLTWHEGKIFMDVLNEIPRIVMGVLPLYAPCLWWAISANKSTKLSKRLSEEYMHKESIMKTYEGLSTQIEGLKKSSAATELKERLLYNLLEVSSENPGKLILNYNQSDNPIFDILDKSRKLGETLERFKGWPGVEVVLNKMQQKNEKEKKELEDNADSGMSFVDNEKTKDAQITQE